MSILVAMSSDKSTNWRRQATGISSEVAPFSTAILGYGVKTRFQNYSQWTVKEINSFDTNSCLGLEDHPEFSVKFLFSDTNLV